MTFYKQWRSKQRDAIQPEKHTASILMGKKEKRKENLALSHHVKNRGLLSTVNIYRTFCLQIHDEYHGMGDHLHVYQPRFLRQIVTHLNKDWWIHNHWWHTIQGSAHIQTWLGIQKKTLHHTLQPGNRGNDRALLFMLPGQRSRVRTRPTQAHKDDT